MFFNQSIRIGLLGSVDVGKSSLLGVLKTNKLDDGRGSSRKNIMYHKHELLSGKTSSVTSQYIELDNNFITFIDLAGHETYLKTTIYGLYGLNLDMVFILIGANMGINKMTKEHFQLAKFLDIPIIFIINKIDICPNNILNETFTNLKKMIQLFTNNEKNLIVYENDDLINNIENHKKLFTDNETIYLYNENINKINNYYNIIKTKKDNIFDNNIFKKYYPLLFISNKDGYGINNLKYFLNNIIHSNYILNYNNIKQNNKDTNNTNNTNNNNTNNTNNIDNIDNIDNINTFIIQTTYNVNGIGIVFFGYVKYGCIKKNDTLFIGPFNNSFYKIYIRNIRNIHNKDIPTLEKNSFGCLAIKQLEKTYILKKNNIRKGIYITNTPKCYKEFIAKIYILHHPTTIKQNYQPTIHCGTVIQAAKILEIINIKDKNKEDKNNKFLRSGDIAKIKFLFLFRPEYIEKNSLFIFRENNSKGIGKILDLI